MSRHLSSLVPGFEGHWVCGYWGISKTTSIYCRSAWGITALPENGDKIICPAWQVEDVLKNIFKIAENFKEKGIWKDGELLFINDIIHEISCFLSFNDFETAYQKIEEYLWGILK
jgi:hypothetical protein